MFNFNHLYYFYMVVTHEGITAASKALRISQPALSAQISSLERSLDRKLFTRHGRKLVISEEGQMIYGQCRKMFEIAEGLQRRLETGTQESPKLHLGVAQEVERPFLVSILSSWLGEDGHRRRPAISMRSDEHKHLIHRLQTGGFDAVITNQPVFDPDLSILAQVPMPVVLAFRAKGRFRAIAGNSRSPHFRDIFRGSDLDWVLPTKGLRLRTETDRFLEKAQLEPRVSFETDVPAALVRAVLDDVGVALLPYQYLSTHLRSKSLSYAGPEKGFWKHGFWLVSSARWQENPSLRELKALFERKFASTTLRDEIQED